MLDDESSEARRPAGLKGLHDLAAGESLLVSTRSRSRARPGPAQLDEAADRRPSPGPPRGRSTRTRGLTGRGVAVRSMDRARRRAAMRWRHEAAGGRRRRGWTGSTRATMSGPAPRRRNGRRPWSAGRAWHPGGRSPWRRSTDRCSPGPRSDARGGRGTGHWQAAVRGAGAPERSRSSSTGASEAAETEEEEAAQGHDEESRGEARAGVVAGVAHRTGASLLRVSHDDRTRGCGGGLADPTGFEPAISSVTGWHVGPLHHGSRRDAE